MRLAPAFSLVNKINIRTSVTTPHKHTIGEKEKKSRGETSHTRWQKIGTKQAAGIFYSLARAI